MLNLKKLLSPWPLLLLIPLSIWLLFVGFKNEKDPYWLELDKLTQKKFLSLDKAVDSIRVLHDRFHGTKSLPNDSTAYQKVATPFLPTMEFEKLNQYFSLFFERRSVIFAAVTGSGNTTLVDRIAKLIATKPENKMLIRCAPQFDLEYNKKYIGRFEGETFIKGDLLKFWDKCRQFPNEKFVCMIDNIDKINPETFFGPDIWSKLDQPAKMKEVFGKDTVTVPPNYYQISITQTGVGQKIELTDEHFRRLGGIIQLPIHENELIMYLNDKKIEVQKNLLKYKIAPPQYEKEKTDFGLLIEQEHALNDKVNVKKMVYCFKKSNEMIVEKYSYGHQIGQWSDIRKYFLPKDFEKIENTFITHVNAFRPDKELKKSDFDDVLYAIKHDGSVPNTSPIWVWGGKLAALGFASELGVAGIFALISGIIGWFYFKKRQTYIKDFTEKIYVLMAEYDSQNCDYDQIVAEINQTKRDFDALVLSQKVDYSEAAFFYGFIQDKTQHISMAREINESFLKLINVFLDDGFLSDSEYQKLNQFLESIRFRISTPQYLGYKEEIERLHQEFGETK